MGRKRFNNRFIIEESEEVEEELISKPQKRVSFQRCSTPPPSPKLPKEKIERILTLQDLSPFAKRTLREKIHSRIEENNRVQPFLSEELRKKIGDALIDLVESL